MKKHNYNLVIGIVALIMIILVVSLVGYFVSRPADLVIQGEAEATEYRVSGKIPGRIEELRAVEGQEVHKGDTLVVIDSPEVRSGLAEARAARAAASAQLKKARNGARQEQITGAYELWQQAIVQEEVLAKSFERIKKLKEEKVVTDQKYDEVEAQYRAAQARSGAWWLMRTASLSWGRQWSHPELCRVPLRIWKAIFP